METKNLFFEVYQFVLIAVLIIGPIIGIYFFGKKFRKKYDVSQWYFWLTYIFAVPIIAAPIVLFGSLFMDKVKHDNLVPIAWVMINTYAMWFILGFIGSMKLYKKCAPYFAILPSVLSWIFALAAIWGGIYLINY